MESLLYGLLNYNPNKTPNYALISQPKFGLCSEELTTEPLILASLDCFLDQK